MYLLPSLISLAVFIFTGMVLFRFIATRLIKGGQFIDDTELHCHGIALGILTNAVIGQFLAIFQIFNLWSFAAIFLFAVFVLNREATQVLVFWLSLPRRYFQLFKEGNLLLAGAWALFLFLVIFSLFRTQLSSSITDVLAIHMGISQKLINNSGFIYPRLVGSNFYGAMPSFVDMMFAEVWMLHDDRMIIRALHFTLYVGFLVSIFAFSKRAKWLAVLILCFILPSANLYPLALQGMNDTARAVFEALSIIFLVMYAKRENLVYLIYSGLLLGAAMASKYFGLGTAFVCGLIWLFILFPNRFKKRKYLIHLCLFSVPALLVGGFWYAKNWYFLGNPIYPFVFGHPGISDIIMANIDERLPQHMNRAYWDFNRDFFSFAAWLDMPIAIHKAYIPELAPIRSSYVYLATAAGLLFLAVGYLVRPIKQSTSLICGFAFFAVLAIAWAFQALTVSSIILVFLAASSLHPREKTNLITAAAIAWCAIWYFFIWRGNRYGITPQLLLLSAFYFSAVTVSESFLSSPFIYAAARGVRNLGGRHGVAASSFIASFIVAGFMFTGLNLSHRTQFVYNFNKDFFAASFKKNGREKVLSKYHHFWGLYSFIVRNGLTNVLNPWHTAAPLHLFKIVREDAPRNTFLNWYIIPKSIEDMDSFIKKRKIKYFVAVKSFVKDKPPLPKVFLHYRMGNPYCGGLGPKDSKPCGLRHANMARSIYFALKPRSEIAYEDSRYILLRIKD